MGETGDSDGDLTMTEAARKFGVSYATIRRKVDAGVIPIVRKAPNGIVYIRPRDVDPDILAHARRLAKARWTTRMVGPTAVTPDGTLRADLRRLEARVAKLERMMRRRGWTG